MQLYPGFHSLHKLENVGHGPATVTGIRWIYDAKAVDEVINGVYVYRNARIVSSPTLDWYPGANVGDSTMVELPLDFLLCYGSKLNWCIGKSESVVPSKPPLTLRITFLNQWQEPTMLEYGTHIHGFDQRVEMRFYPLNSLERVEPGDLINDVNASS